MVNSETESRELSFFPSVYALAAVLGVAPGAIARLPLNEVGRQIAFKASAEFINPSQQRLDFSNAEYEVAGGVTSVTLDEDFACYGAEEGGRLPLESKYLAPSNKVYIFARQASESIFALVALLGMRGILPGTDISLHILELKDLENPYIQGNLVLESARVPSIVVVLNEQPSSEFKRTMQGIAQVNCLPISIVVENGVTSVPENSICINLEDLTVTEESIDSGRRRYTFEGISSELLQSDEELNASFFYDYVPMILMTRAMMTKRWRGQGFPADVDEDVYLHSLRMALLTIRMIEKIQTLQTTYNLEEDPLLFNPIALVVVGLLHDFGEVFSLLGDIPAGHEHRGVLKVVAKFLERNAIVRLVQNNIVPGQAVELFEAFESRATSSDWGLEAAFARLADGLLGARFHDVHIGEMTDDELRREAALRIERNLYAVQDIVEMIEDIMRGRTEEIGEFIDKFRIELLIFLTHMMPEAKIELRIVDDKVIIFAGDRVLMPLEDLELSKEAIYVD